MKIIGKPHQNKELTQQFIEKSKDWKTGDIILFNTTSGWFAKMVEYFTNSLYSHVGMIVKDPEFTEKPLVGLYFWESSREVFPDAEDNEIKLGVEIVDLEKILQHNTNLYYRKLVLEDGFELDHKKLAEIHKVAHNKPYDYNILDWILAWFKTDITSQKTDRFWCSALVGYIYTKLGLLPEDTDWSILTPKDFSTEKSGFPLQHCHLEPEVKI
jgi:hypothetical protein